MAEAGGGDRRQEILAAAGALLLEAGVAAFSMRQLAERVGLSPPALYRHFQDREDLLITVVNDAFDRFEEHLGRGLTGTTAQERLALLAQGYLDFALDHPREYALVFLLPGAFGLDRVPGRIQERVNRSLRFWVDRVREAADAGWIAPADPGTVAVTLAALAHGLVAQRMRGGAPEDRDAFRRLFWEAGIRVFEGLAGEAYSRDRLPEFVVRALEEEGP